MSVSVSDGLDLALSKIRPHTTSSLEHQKTPATLSPTAYFAALLTTLDGTLQKDSSLALELYLLALIAPFVSPPVIRGNLDTILSLTSPLFPSLMAHAPPLRSQIGLYGSIIKSLDRSSWKFRLCLDSRPKVRKRAGEAVKDVLSSPPAPLIRHPYSDRVAEWVKSTLADVSANPVARSKHNRSNMEAAEVALHLLSFLRLVIVQLPPSSHSVIVTLLLTLPRLGNHYLSQCVYSILSDLLSATIKGDDLNVVSEVPQILKADANPQASAGELGKVWKAVWVFLESSDAIVRKASCRSLALLAECFTPEFIIPAMQEHSQPEPKSALGKVVSQAEKAFESLAFARSMSELLSTISVLIANLRYRDEPAGPTAAEVLLLPKSFEHKEAADKVLSQAMATMGPAVLLNALPLNLEPTDRQSGREPRAFLLPLLAQPHPSPLGHFVSYFVPLSERMFNLQQKAESEGRHSEAKVWKVLIAQVWAGLPGYCWSKADTQEVSQALVENSITILALKILVDSNVIITSQDQSLLEKLPPGVRADNISQEQAAKNVDFLRNQAESWLAVLFNMFGSADRDTRGMVGEVIAPWLSIAGDSAITQAYHKVSDLFEQNLKKNQFGRGLTDTGNVVAMAQDLLVFILPYLSTQDAIGLFDMIMSKDVLVNQDNGIQKRGYRILARLIEGGKLSLDVESTIRRLDELSDGLSPAAKKDRLQLYANLMPSIPTSALHIIPSLIPEAVLGTKEPSEKARSAAFELIITMGKKMAEGGIVKRDLVDGMEGDGADEAKANLEEYITMIAAGLAGATPHMISATVTAISRLVFEFKDIVKSTLGFIKLAVHTLSEDLIRPQLRQLVPALLVWAHDHKNHFKTKVQHIFERMIRRFGFQDVHSCSNDEEAAKVLLNIKKRKDRAKRKKSFASGDANEEPSRPTTGDAFEDVLYASESELGDSDKSDEEVAGTTRKRKTETFATRLRLDDDEPMDLLSGAASRVTSAKSSRRSKHRQDTSHFKTDEETGKMIIDDSDLEAGGAAEEDVAGTAYQEAITSVDGFTRRPGGRVKFNKDTKKRRREDVIDDDVEMGETEPARTGKKRSEVKPGHEFKAKAGGDLKRKGGVDPYAYVSLKQAAKKSSRRNRLGVAGKR
ncbi:armadillo-type protein [Multifurca ochricompacta]|uniref:Armadillo-type protein n=1 Tax=Multifurca ochricompacta TaxID=376703 RepID=A0AAD4M8G5_9AGAM|nr:armadillo-type protein [Multifurca ochricompacta]